VSGNENRSGPRGPGALRKFLTGGGRVRSVITLAVAGCAAALFLATGALATDTGNTGNDARCTAGGCPEPNPFGFPLGADTIPTSVLALPSPPKTSEEVFYSHGTPAGATATAPGGAAAVFGVGSDIFASSAGSAFGNVGFPADLAQLPIPQGGIFLFVLRDASDTPIGFGSEMEISQPGGFAVPHNTHASDWIASIPGRGVLWLNSNDNTGSPDLPTTIRPDGSAVQDVTTGPAPGGHGVIVGGSGEFAHRTGTWDELDITKPGFPALGTFEFELHIHWDQKPMK
jgi:hypothetical protein